MPDISLLNPVVLRGVVEKFVAPESMIMLNRLGQTPWPFPSATWDVVRGSRNIASPNVPNSEAFIVPRLGRSQESASFVYLREKKVFEPTTLHWLRTPGEVAKVNAEKAVMREIHDLNVRFDNYAEYCIWQALSGTLTINTTAVQASVNYNFLATHLPSASTAWASVTSPKSIIQDLRTWKRLVARDGRVPAKEAFATEATVGYIFDAYSNSTGNNTAPVLLSDRMKDQYYTTGALPGFMGLNWTVNESVYDDASAVTGGGYGGGGVGTQTLFLPDNKVALGNYEEGRPIEVLVGPTADDEAPEGFTGKFAKTWKDKDPSARQYLLEWIFLPIITRPEQLLYASC